MSRKPGEVEAHYSDMAITFDQWRRMQERERLERRARQFMRDLEYKAALGLSVSDELPKALGSAGGTHLSKRPALRGTKRLTA